MNKQILATMFAAFAFSPSTGNAAEQEQTRATMQRIYESLRVVLPLSVDQARFHDPAAEPTIRQALRLLTEHTGTLSDHVADSDVGSEYLGRSLANYAADTYRDFHARRYDGAQALVQRMTTFCIACHSKLPSHADAPLTAGFVAKTQLTNLPLEQQAGIQVATRQFDAAILSYEQVLADQSVHPANLVSGPLTDYLILCIRVKGDVSRPLPVLEAFERRPNLWQAFREDVQHWITLLQALRDLPQRPASLEQGRDMIESASTAGIHAMDRRPLVQYIAASSILNRVIRNQDSNALSAREMAEAYYLLGLSEYRIGRDYWVLQGDYYLETAIRLAPAAPAARQAYALLEEETIFGYTGSSGTNIPVDVQEHLDGLRRLVNGKEGTVTK